MKKYPKSAVWNKLVRDGIPQYLEEVIGVEVVQRIISKEEAIEELKKKIIEEVEEIEETENSEEVKEEMADILEVFYGLLDEYDIKFEEVEEARKAKLDKRGAFKERIYLIETKERA